MAKKKDLDDENINEENQGDINEADDSFGLPDVDYKPLEEQEVVEEEAYSDPVQEEEQEAFAYAEDDSDSSDVDEEQAAYVPGSYSPPKEGNNKAGVIIGVILVLLLAVVAIWYFGFHKPAKDAEQAKIEKQRQEAAAKKQREAELKAEQDRIAREQAEAEAAAQAEEETAEPEAGIIETISTRTNRYYVVIASAIDGDLAMDYAKDLSESGESVKIIEPYGNVKFYRVTIQDLDTWDEAQGKANELKADYGDGVWVIKY